MTPPDYLLIGHMTADITPQGRILGGTVSYAARTATAFGLRVGVLTSARPDDPLLQELKQYADVVHFVPAEETSTFENIYTSQGRQQYIRGVAAPLSYDALPLDWRQAPLVHIGPLTGELDPAAWLSQFDHSLTLFTAQGLLRQWDANGLVTFKRWFDPVALKKLDWLVLSEEDIALAPSLEDDYASVAAHFVLTRAENGGTHYQKGAPYAYVTPQVEAVHPTGAGDIFAAALLCSLYLSRGNIEKSLAVAARLGANSVTRRGLEGAPTPAEVKAVLQAVKADQP